MKRIVPSLLIAALVLPLSVSGQETAPSEGIVLEDFEFVREAVERGEILPMSQLLPKLREVSDGQIIEVELELDEASIKYEFEILDKTGHLIEVEIDARTGAILGVGQELR